jgi:hypothetical protein
MKMLIKVERSLNIYRKSGNNSESEFLLDIPFEIITTIVASKEDDPLLYDGYILNEEQVNQFAIRIGQKIIVDLNEYFYVLECAGVYE